MLLIGFPEAMETQTLILGEMDPRGTTADTGVSPQRSHPLCPGAGSRHVPLHQLGARRGCGEEVQAALTPTSAFSLQQLDQLRSLLSGQVPPA